METEQKSAANSMDHGSSFGCLQSAYYFVSLCILFRHSHLSIISITDAFLYKTSGLGVLMVNMGIFFREASALIFAICSIS